jgi:hypothetical protein
MNDIKVKIEEEHGSGFTAGLMMGMVFGGIASYMFGTPNGKKSFKDAIARGQEILETLEERVGTVEIAHEVKEAYQEADSPKSFVANLQKKFFKKNGKKLTK